MCCLEQGDWVDHAAAPTLGEDWEARRQRDRHPNPNVRALPSDYPVNDADTPLQPSMYNAVGGSTIHWGAHFPRFRPSDFCTATLDGVGDDWPIGYRDLDAAYAANDRAVGVSGLAGDPANPPRPPRAMGPIDPGPGAVRIAGAFNRLGWHWWPSDAAVATRPYEGRGACNNCGPCDLGCPQLARSSADVTYWPAALAAGARLHTRARVAEITTDPRGRASGARYYDAEGREHHQPASAVVLAANGVGTARLLLLSGLANSSGLVGRRLMHHVTAMVTGIFDEDLAAYAGPFAMSIVSQEFYETDPSRGFARGFQLQLMRGDGPLGTALGTYLPRLPWGARHHAEHREQLGRTATLIVTAEDLPEEHNRVTIDPSLRDGDGIPAPALHYRVSENSGRIVDFGIERAGEALREAGARTIVERRLVNPTGFHLLGTARMGDDPARSVVDGWCRSHDVPNLYVIDGSVFVTCAAVNPTSTIQAIALRAAQRLASTRGRG